VEKTQLDEKGNLQNVSAKSLDQRCRRGGGATGGKQVIDQQHAAPWLECINVDCHGGPSHTPVRILLREFDKAVFPFSARYKSGLKFYGCRRSKYETTGVDPNHRIDASSFNPSVSKSMLPEKSRASASTGVMSLN